MAENTKLKLIITAVIVAVIGLIVGFNLLSGTSTNLIEAGNSVTDANNCSLFDDSGGNAWTYNQTSKNCYNSSQFEQTAGQFDLPLNSLYSSSGVLFLILMAFIFVGLIGWLVVRTRMKG